MKVVKKNKPIPVEETITIELTVPELAMIVTDMGTTNGFRCADEYEKQKRFLGMPEINVDLFSDRHNDLYSELIQELECW